jgi:hypothetical protein
LVPYTDNSIFCARKYLLHNFLVDGVVPAAANAKKKAPELSLRGFFGLIDWAVPVS